MRRWPVRRWPPPAVRGRPEATRAGWRGSHPRLQPQQTLPTLTVAAIQGCSGAVPSDDASAQLRNTCATAAPAHRRLGNSSHKSCAGASAATQQRNSCHTAAQQQPHSILRRLTRAALQQGPGVEGDACSEAVTRTGASQLSTEAGDSRELAEGRLAASRIKQRTACLACTQAERPTQARRAAVPLYRRPRSPSSDRQGAALAAWYPRARGYRQTAGTRLASRVRALTGAVPASPQSMSRARDLRWLSARRGATPARLPDGP